MRRIGLSVIGSSGEVPGDVSFRTITRSPDRQIARWRSCHYAGAAVWSGFKNPKGEIRPARFAVCDAKGARLENCAYLYGRD